MVQFNQRFDFFENKLSYIGGFPVIGTVAGVVKISMGLIQTIGGLSAGIFLSISAACQKNKDWTLALYAWTHVKHGLGNIIAGTLEAIPFVGLIMNVIRVHRSNSISKQVVYIRTNQDHKFMPYLSLEAQSFKIMGTKDSAVENVMANLKDIDSLPPEEKLKQARQAVRNYYANILK